MAGSSVNLSSIECAREAIARSVRHTPLIPSAALSAHTGADVRLKLESLQDTGAFKIRGATNRIAPG